MMWFIPHNQPKPLPEITFYSIRVNMPSAQGDVQPVNGLMQIVA
jgi:hypothetical protein